MNWINSFELLCYGLTVALLLDIGKKKSWHELQLLLSGALAGFILELGAVRLTDIYHYSDAYFVSIGRPPYQFPFFGGLMWGWHGSLRLKNRPQIALESLLESPFFAGWLVVSFDLLLDVVAIRLDGGFWVWEGRPINLDINHHMWMSVIWVNFLGYLFETPALIYLTLRQEDRARKKTREDSLGGLQAMLDTGFRVLATGLGAVAFVAVASGIALYLDSVTDEWASFLAFVGLWLTILGKLLVTLKEQAANLTWRGQKDKVLILFWASLYGYCLLALASLGILAALPLYALFAFGLLALTLAMCMIQFCRES